MYSPRAISTWVKIIAIGIVVATAAVLIGGLALFHHLAGY